jgi:hypothetical protein
VVDPSNVEVNLSDDGSQWGDALAQVIDVNVDAGTYFHTGGFFLICVKHSPELAPLSSITNNLRRF